VSLPARPIDHAFLCGPQGVIEAAKVALGRLGVPAPRVHVELFTPSLPTGSAAAARQRGAATRTGEALAAIAVATVRLDGATHSFPVSAGEGVIDAGLRAGLELPFSCKGGMCCTCRAKLVSGTVEMVQNYSLEPWEMEKGFVLACQSRPTSPELTLDFDEA
jgi:ring-1,2-phenylacetyl-CoA epoxidase subunit PaaE